MLDGLAGLLVGVRGDGAAAPAEVARLVNDARRGAGLHPLRVDRKLTRCAARRARHLARTERLSHDGWLDALRKFGWPRNLGAGENIAVGYAAAATVMDGWMNSDGHRRNILDPEFRAIGVGVAIDDDGDHWWAQAFGG